MCVTPEVTFLVTRRRVSASSACLARGDKLVRVHEAANHARDLGVDDLARAVAFYRDGLGLRTKGIVGREFEYGAVAFFELQHGVQLAPWPRASLARDTGLPVQPGSATEFSLGHNVNSKAEVDGVMAQAAQAGAAIVKPAADTFWGGYAGYFQDPDGHLWEVAWNPQIPVAE